MNFSIFDLDEKNLNVIIANKPTFVSDQISASPIEFLKSPSIVRNNPAYQQIAVQKMPAIGPLISGNSNEHWEEAISMNSDLIVNAPVTLYNFRDRVIAKLKNKPKLILQSPRSIGRDSKLLKEVVNENSFALAYISPTTPNYKEIAIISVQENGYALRYIPTELRDYKEIAIISVQVNGYVLQEVPEDLRDYDICLAAVKQNGKALGYVPREPKDLRDYELCLAAVKQDSIALEYVPRDLRDYYDICLAAVKHNGYALVSVPREPKDLRDYKLCLAAVKQNGKALEYVPREPKDLRDYELCLTAVKQNSIALEYVPRDLKAKIIAGLKNPDELDRVKELAERLNR